MESQSGRLTRSGTKRFLPENFLQKLPNDSRKIRRRAIRLEAEDRDPFENPPQTPTRNYHNHKVRYGDEVASHPSYYDPPSSSSSLEVSCSSGSISDPSLTPFSTNNLPIHLTDLAEFEEEVHSHLTSNNDPYLTDTGRSRDLHTPTNPEMLSPESTTMPMSPSSSMIIPSSSMHSEEPPDTPMPRPLTPTPFCSPLTPMITSTSLDHDDDDDTESFAGTSLSHYGLPPTPMCPPQRVGILSSSSSSATSLLQLSPAIRNPQTMSAAPPKNILQSDDDDEDDFDIDFSNNQINKSNIKSYPFLLSPPSPPRITNPNIVLARGKVASEAKDNESGQNQISSSTDATSSSISSSMNFKKFRIMSAFYPTGEIPTTTKRANRPPPPLKRLISVGHQTGQEKESDKTVSNFTPIRSILKTSTSSTTTSTETKHVGESKRSVNFEESEPKRKRNENEESFDGRISYSEVTFLKPNPPNSKSLYPPIPLPPPPNCIVQKKQDGTIPFPVVQTVACPPPPKLFNNVIVFQFLLS